MHHSPSHLMSVPTRTHLLFSPSLQGPSWIEVMKGLLFAGGNSVWVPLVKSAAGRQQHLLIPISRQ